MNDEVKKKLNELFLVYSKNLPGKIEHIGVLWDMQQNHWDFNQFQVFHREVHSLCGSAGTYGYSQLSKAARQMEVFLKTVLNKGSLSGEDQIQITNYFNQLESVLSTELVNQEMLEEEKLQVSGENKIVYILERDKSINSQIYTCLKKIDYEPYIMQDMITLQRAVVEKPPVALIIDTDYLIKDGIEHLLEIQKNQPLPIQIICILPNGELMPRLDAIRAGCDAFFQKPVDVGQLTHILNFKCSVTTGEPYRILIVDDSEALAEYYALILNQAGMTARALTNPLNLLKELEIFKPNLLLMDVYMPECTGFELAAVLRQESRYTKIPIIFLSTEDDKDKKLYAISLGGDDFLTKPISPQHLISAVRSRSKRASILNQYMITDSLTGLLNHSSILNQLDIELARARHDHSVLSFIMVDIDHFKKINDTYGHPVGDMVIKELSSIFLSKTRSKDNVGRYGGEEFALILPGSTAENSKKLINNIREHFSQYCFKIDGADFQVTFSAGISFFDGAKDNTTIIEQADQALYKAKQLGRNKVILFNE